jgi:hypothetical protein
MQVLAAAGYLDLFLQGITFFNNQMVSAWGLLCFGIGLLLRPLAVLNVAL